MVILISFTDFPKNCSEAVCSSSSAFMILHWATPVTVKGTPWAVSTVSHIGFNVITSSESLWTSVTNHQAHAHPPTIVTRFVDPQHPPKRTLDIGNQPPGPRPSTDDRYSFR
ncbi:hypothetical protein QE152_g14414 [Popillia japonica]|uniref:Uncharacterized protein n=1 Tax=Popillia japonica TaxID=7064 RepID=A0AAW1L9H9_POPJA